MSKSGQSVLRGARQALSFAKRGNGEPQTYDALLQPDPQSWLALDEGERIWLVEDYHRRKRVPLSASRRKAHAIFHAIIESQIAEGGEPMVQRALERLMAEGLDRHDAVHAAASIMAEMIHVVARDETPFSAEAYREALGRLTAQSWLDGDWEC